MRGEDTQQAAMFSYVSPEQRVAKDHPLRTVRALAETVLTELAPQFAGLYSRTGRPSIAPEKLLRTLLLQVLYSVRSERLMMEQLEYNMLFRWFVGLNIDEPVWDASVFSKNRDRLLAGDIAREFFVRVRALADAHHLLSDEHFTVDGTMIEAWAGQKSFQRTDRPGPPPRDGTGGGVNFRGERRSNDTHASTTDPEARLYRKTRNGESKLCYLGHVLIDNRHGLVVDARVTPATGYAEREAALAMASGCKAGSTLGADKAYDTKEFVAGLRALGVVPHVAQNTNRRRSAIDRRTTRHPGYAISQYVRHRVERVFGWGKTIGLMRKTRHRGAKRVGWAFTFIAAAYDLVRISRLISATG